MNTPHWHELNNLHAGGQMALIVGKGPSLDAWLAQGCPRPDCAHAVIALNNAALALEGAGVVADYGICQDRNADYARAACPWLTCLSAEHTGIRFSDWWQVPKWASWWFHHLAGDGILDLTREQIADTHHLFGRSSTAQPAVHFAWYLGFDAVQCIGIDGGREKAEAAKKAHGYYPSTPDYTPMRRHTHELADRLFPGRWWHWGTVKEGETRSGGEEETVPVYSTREALAAARFTGTGAELGVAAGAFSQHILRHTPARRLYSIDRWSDHHDTREYLAAVERLAGIQGGAVSVPLRMTFSEALPLFADASLSFIYIDGYAHTGQDGGQTLRDWWPKLRPGGVFAGHDYDPQYPATLAAVDAFVRKHRLTLHLTAEPVNPSWWCVKPQ